METHISTSWQLTGGPYRLAKVVFQRLLLASALCCLALPVSAATRHFNYDGPLVNGYRYWSDPDNWSPNGAPQDGEDLVFRHLRLLGPDPDLEMVNDLTNLTVRSLQFAITDFGDANVHLHGYALGISDGIFNTNEFECQVYIHCGVTLMSDARFVTGDAGSALFGAEDTSLHLIGPIDLNEHWLRLEADAGFGNNGRLFIEGGISGSGAVMAVVGGEERFPGGVNYYDGSIEFKVKGNDFSGTFDLVCRPGSEIRFNVSSGVVVNDRVNMYRAGTVKLARPNQIGDAATVRLQDGATLQLNGYDDTILNPELLT